MADITDTREQRPEPEADAGAEPNALRPTLDLALFNTDDITRLQELRERIEHGRVTELDDDHKRLLFARWMYEQGKLDG
jgi:hypothetical protein